MITFLSAGAIIIFDLVSIAPKVSSKEISQKESSKSDTFIERSDNEQTYDEEKTAIVFAFRSAE